MVTATYCGLSKRYPTHNVAAAYGIGNSRSVVKMKLSEVSGAGSMLLSNHRRAPHPDMALYMLMLMLMLILALISR